MIMTRRERLSLEASQLKLLTGLETSILDSPSEENVEELLGKMAGFSSSKHVPLKDTMNVLRIPIDSIISFEDLTVLFMTLQSRAKGVKPGEKVEEVLGKVKEAIYGNDDTLFKWNGKKKGEKDLITKAECTTKIMGLLSEEDHQHVPETVDYISYNFKDHIRVIDLINVVNEPPNPDVENDEEDNDISEDKEDEEDIKRREEFEEMTKAIEEAEELAKASVDPSELTKVINFLDPSDDGEIDMKELENAFRVARKDSKRKTVNLGRQKEQMEKLKADLAKASVVEEEKSDFSDEEIEKVINFLDPNRDGITTDEFEKGFRDARRARATAVMEKKGREQLTKLLIKIKEVHPEFETPTEWFILVNTSPGPPGSPVEVTGLELRAGLKKLGGFTNSDIDSLLKYMDPDGDCDLTVPEFEEAQERLEKPADSDSKASEAGAVIVRLEVHMDEANIRMIDLFRMMDKDGEGSIEPDEMKAGLKRLALPSGVERAKKKIAKEKLVKKISEEMEARKKQLAMDKRQQEAESSGAAKVLRDLEASMIKKGQRMIDLFREMDKSGDGLISRQELLEGLKAMAGPTAHQKAVMKRMVEDQERRMAELQEKEMKDAAVKDKVLKAVESGAASVLGRLYEFITDGEQEKKIQDIFREYDSSGEGSLSHGELAMAMELLDMEMTDSEVAAFVNFIDESGDGDVDLMELDSALKAFLRIRRQNPNFGKRSKERMSSEQVDSLVEYVMEKLDGEIDADKLEALFSETNAINSDVMNNPKFQTDAHVMNSTKKYKDWLSSSRLSRAPTGRLPSLKDQLSEEQLLELETAKLRIKKERKIAGEAHFKHWLEKKVKEDKVKVQQFIEAEQEELGGALPPIALLNGEQIGQVVDFTKVASEGVEQPESVLAGLLNQASEEAQPEDGGGGTGTIDRISCEMAKAAFLAFRPASLGSVSITDPAVSTFVRKLNEKKGDFAEAKGAFLTVWRHNTNVLDVLGKELTSPLPINEFRQLLVDKICKSTSYKSKEAFAAAKAEFEESEKRRQKEEAAEAWKEWSGRKDKELRQAKRARKKEFKDLLAKQQKEFDEMRAEKKRRKAIEDAKYMTGLKGSRSGKSSLASTTGSIGGKSKTSKRSMRSNLSTMSKSVALSLCEASISPYGVDPGKNYSKKNLVMKEKLKHLRKKKGKLPAGLRAEAEAFRKAVSGPVPKHFTPLVGTMVGGGYMDDGASVAASSISGDSLSLMEDQRQFDKESNGEKKRGLGEMEGEWKVNAHDRPTKAGVGASLGRPPKPTGSKGRSVNGAKGGATGGLGATKGRGKAEEREDEDDVYGDDFEDFPSAPGSAGDTLVTFDIVEMSLNVEEEVVGENLDFFNSETVAELPMDVYGDDFEDEGEGGDPYKVPLIEATPPPAGHFSRPSTSGTGEGRPVSRSSSTEGSRDRRNRFQ
ncbi:hypothetical protein TrLO_g8713 [Triparma laevis f. longispina]|uniref:EF-hand domain-containing protein n=1 Tax=Triparma laevis f. longispina TaxID=1714387 RepID=A0A9W7E3U6_9STRA|nr:hypothetical protein TrLO_g8713 [Triparma laevis f. longispina]